MTVENRRRQLLEAGADLFAADPAVGTTIDDVIGAAGVSRALFYRHFSGKREFFVELVRHAAAQIRIATEPESDLPPIERLRKAIDGYLDVVVARPTAYRAVYGGSMSGDPEVRAIIDDNLAQQESRLLEEIAPNRDASDLLHIVVRGWLSFTITTVLTWLESGTPRRDTVRDLLVDVLVASVTAVEE